jgi:hypothetical protein
MNTAEKYKNQIFSGRISTVLASWMAENIKEEKLSYIFLKDILNLFFESKISEDFRKEDYTLPIFSKIVRGVLKENGLFEKCTFKRRQSGILITGITINVSGKYNKNNEDIEGITEHSSECSVVRTLTFVA